MKPRKRYTSGCTFLRCKLTCAANCLFNWKKVTRFGASATLRGISIGTYSGPIVVAEAPAVPQVLLSATPYHERLFITLADLRAMPRTTVAEFQSGFRALEGEWALGTGRETTRRHRTLLAIDFLESGCALAGEAGM